MQESAQAFITAHSLKTNFSILSKGNTSIALKISRKSDFLKFPSSRTSPQWDHVLNM